MKIGKYEFDMTRPIKLHQLEDDGPSISRWRERLMERERSYEEYLRHSSGMIAGAGEVGDAGVQRYRENKFAFKVFVGVVLFGALLSGAVMYLVRRIGYSSGYMSSGEIRIGGEESSFERGSECERGDRSLDYHPVYSRDSFNAEGEGVVR